MYRRSIFFVKREHGSPHIHVEFLGSAKRVRLGWPSLEPLPGEPTLSVPEHKDVRDYMATHHDQIDRKVQKVFQQPDLAPAV